MSYRNYKCFFKYLFISYLVYLEFVLLLNIKILQASLFSTSIINYTLNRQIITLKHTSIAFLKKYYLVIFSTYDKAQEV